MDLGLSPEVVKYLLGALSTGAVWFFGSNTKLKEGVSDWLLKHLNKTKINYLPLNKHRVFAALSEKRSAFTYFIMDEPVKIEFYKRYVNITFDAFHTMAKNISQLENEKGDITSEILSQVEIASKTIDIEMENQLIIPDKISNSFAQWRAMLKASFRDSLVDVLNDDLVDSNYFLCYRTLDALIAQAKITLNSGALEFSRLNGQFKSLTIEDITKKNVNKSISQ